MTHGIHWLPLVDSIVVVVDGTITEHGTYDELMNQNAAFARFLKQYLIEHPKSEDEINFTESLLLILFFAFYLLIYLLFPVDLLFILIYTTLVFYYLSSAITFTCYSVSFNTYLPIPP